MIFFVRPLLLAFLACVALASSFATPTGYAQELSPAATFDRTAARLLEQGIELEKGRQWIQAIQHYEKAVRQHKSHSELRRRLLIARLHHDVVRRGSDSAIVDLIRTASLDEALDLYSEVIARLEMSYVEPVEMTDIVRGGTAYLEVALTEPVFVDTYAKKVPADRIEQFRTSIHRVTLANPVKTRFEARSIVAQAAKSAEKNLGISPTATVMQFVFGAVGLLDPYSSFLSAAELNEVESQIEGNFVGLGVALQPHEAPLRVLAVIPGGPAEEAGLQAGDLILEIGSTNCTEVGAERAADLLRGPEQSQVRILVQRPRGSSFERVVVRRRVEVPSIEDVHLADPSAGIAYLKISSFQKTTAGELDAALWKLHHQGMQSLIIDVRGNPGGWLDAAVAVADRFVTEGGIVTTRGKNGIENQNYRAERSGTWQVPLVLLLDSQSASASEILAGAIRDNQRGTLVGSTSYGKGSVQGLYHTKAFKSGLRLTVSKFYSPSGRAISEQGVQPHIVVGESEADDNIRFTAKVPVSSDVAVATDMNLEATAGTDDAQTDPALEIALQQARQIHLSAKRQGH